MRPSSSACALAPGMSPVKPSRRTSSRRAGTSSGCAATRSFSTATAWSSLPCRASDCARSVALGPAQAETARAMARAREREGRQAAKPPEEWRAAVLWRLCGLAASRSSSLAAVVCRQSNLIGSERRMAHLDEIKTLGVLGAGQMGGGIAQVGAAAGLDVVLVDATQELADKAKKKIGGMLSRQVEKGKMTADASAALLAHIRPAGSPDEFKACDFVVEAAT